MKLDYVTLAYVAFAVVLAWDFVAPRLRLAQVRRAIALRLRREAARTTA
jgi:heme exporter protein D